MAGRRIGDVTQAGALELVFSACLFITAFVTSISAGPGTPTRWLISAAPVFVALLFFGLLLVKRYLIDPRLVSLTDIRPTRPLLLIFGAFGVFLALTYLAPESVLNALGTPLLLALIMTALFLITGQGRPRFYIHVATALLTAALVSVVGVHDTLGTVWVALATGCALLLVGGWVLADFVKQVRS